MTKSVELAQFAGIILADDTSVTFTPTGMRIKGDFSNGTLANRMLFQNSAANSQTSIGVIPSGTATNTSLILFAGSAPDNSTIGFVQQTESIFAVSSSKSGTGAYTPMAFYTGGSERVRLDVNGNLLMTNPAGLGYGSGSGGTVTQTTSKATAVTLNKPAGQITMNAAALAAGVEIGFTLNNTLLAQTDLLLVQINNSGNYQVRATDQAAGSAVIRVKNLTAGSLSDSPLINFAIIKGAAA
ncbi:hypothetical protein UFOVP137_13 [uncultured Caudovirales phage]|uniref:Uncharacterized protein n=1 Tax=uncultured Caudovirales phage TaxID=2100421 RepID=A0A6J5LE67_9CAUD|nr:hypothetical protein UFOVP137_13 [uncultured Caudovirales phage]